MHWDFYRCIRNIGEFFINADWLWLKRLLCNALTLFVQGNWKLWRSCVRSSVLLGVLEHRINKEYFSFSVGISIPSCLFLVAPHFYFVGICLPCVHPTTERMVPGSRHGSKRSLATKISSSTNSERPSRSPSPRIPGMTPFGFVPAGPSRLRVTEYKK